MGLGSSQKSQTENVIKPVSKSKTTANLNLLNSVRYLCGISAEIGCSLPGRRFPVVRVILSFLNGKDSNLKNILPNINSNFMEKWDTDFTK